MKNFSIHAAAFTFLLFSAPAGFSAQEPVGKPPATSEKMPAKVKGRTDPIIIVDVTGLGRMQAKKFKGEVIFFNAQAISLRSTQDGRTIQTFSYTPVLREAVFKLLETGGFQPGDIVTVDYIPNKTVAVRLKGKPSRL